MVAINTIKLRKLIDKIKPNLILFGESHGLLNETKIQEEILRNFQCDIFLYELLEDKKLLSKESQENFILKPDEENFSLISKNKDLKDTIKLAMKFNIPIKGCDIKNMGRENTLFRERELTEKEEKKEEELMIRRELNQFNKINEELFKNKKVFTSVGIYHILPRSELIKNLVGRNIIIVYPIFEDGEQFGYRIEFNLDEIIYTSKTLEEYL